MKIKLRTNNYMALAAVISVFINTITYFIPLLCTYVMGMPAYIGRLFVYVFLAVDFILLALSYRAINKRVMSFALPLGLILLFLISTLSAEKAQLISEQGLMGDTLLKNILAFITIYNLRDTDKFLKYMRVFSVASIVIGMVILIGAPNRIGYMAYGYRLVLGSVFLFADYLNNKSNYFSLGVGVLGVLCILFGGSRGAALICLLIFPLWILFCEQSKNKIKWIAVCIVAILILYFGFDILLPGALNLMNRLNLKSRTIHKILNKTITDDTNRSLLWKFCIDKILHRNVINTLFGYGLAGDRVIILHQFSSFLESGYPHNIVLEILMQFGGVGLFIILWWGYNVYRTVKKTAIPSHRIVLMVFIVYCIQLFISSSYLQNPVFFALTAWCMSHKYRNKTSA